VVRQKGAVFLVVSRTTSTPPLGAETTFAALDAVNPGGGWRSLASVHQIVPAQPAWDTGAGSGGQVQIVYEKAGGAINALALRAPSGETRVLTGEYPMRSFSLPHFAKYAGGLPLWVTAIVDNRICVALPVTQTGSYSELGECTEGLLVKGGSGFVFLAKKAVPGTVRGNSISPGRLQATPLGADLRQRGRPVEVAGGTIYQFDADMVGDKLVIAATIPRGIVVASTRMMDLRFKSQEYAAPETLSYPAMVPAPAGKAALYALDGYSSGKARIIAAEIAVP
jgi:hypothetical protein